MSNTKITISGKSWKAYKGDLVAFVVSGDGKKYPRADDSIKQTVKRLHKIGDFHGKADKTCLLYQENIKDKITVSAQRIVLAGMGELRTKKKDLAELKEQLRSTGGAIATIIRQVKAEHFALVLPSFLKRDLFGGVEQLIEGLLLGLYQFEKYKTQDKDEKKYVGLKKITIISELNQAAIRKLVEKAQAVAEGVMVARDMANEPGNNWTPQHFVEFAQNLSKQTNLICSILDKKELEKKGMGGIIAVNKGSSLPPKLIILEHQPQQFDTTILLVGKGLTFDSGGISLKPAQGMEDMKYDMCGGAAVLATMQVIASEKLPVRVVALVPSTENMSGSSALKPGDIIKHYNGLTSEIVNTDAEGRLILADALAYGIECYNPDCVIDLATLTGAVIIGLGHHRTGLISNNDNLVKRLYEASEACGEPLWRLPLDAPYEKQLESDVADIKNTGGRPGGCITAAAYLKKFVGETAWAHLDIAGTAWNFTKKNYIPKGPSGVGVRTLVELLRSWKNNAL